MTVVSKTRASDLPDARRSLRQPGPTASERVRVAAGALRRLAFDLRPGLTLNDAITGPLIEAGLRGGTVELAGGAFAPMRYVIPALSPDGQHAAWYSDVREPGGETRLERATATVGEREGLPFTHVHAVWREADGSRRGGHILPLETIVAAPIRADAWGCAEATFQVEPDPESNFSLFRPDDVSSAATPLRHTDASVLLVRIGPNEEPCHALEELCEARGITRASVRGIGSLVAVDFADGRHLSSIATELFVRSGAVAPGPDGRARASLDIAIVDRHGAIHEGTLLRGANSVCITMELSVVVHAAGNAR